MKRRELFVVIIVLVVGVITGGVIVISLNNKSPDELYDIATIEGTVLNVNENYIMINLDDDKDSECYLAISDDTVIYIDGSEYDISMIKVGQSVKAEYNGGLDEIYPPIARGVTEITVK